MSSWFKGAFFFAGIFIVGSVQAELGSSWQKIIVPAGTYTVEDGNGQLRDITPSCSGAPICNTDPETGAISCHPGNTQYSFWYKPGVRDKLAIFLMGGGLCWDSESCVTASVFGHPLYSQEPQLNTLPPAYTAFGNGMFDQSNPNNPYKDWSLVFVDYCTADEHSGSSDAVYTDVTGLATGIPGGPVTIHHRGYDNLLYVRDWIKRLYATGNSAQGVNPVSKMLITGYSAGAAGLYKQYPTLRSLFPNAKGYAVADAGVLLGTDYVRDQALANWNMLGNLPGWVPDFMNAYSGPIESVIPGTMAALAAYYPNDRFSNVNMEWDAVLASYYVIIHNVGNIAAWSQVTPYMYAGFVASKDMILHAMDSIPNVRNFEGEGCNHGTLAFNDEYYKPATHQDVSFIDWIKGLTAPGADPAWHNSYTSNPVPPTEQDVFGCLDVLGRFQGL